MCWERNDLLKKSEKLKRTLAAALALLIVAGYVPAATDGTVDIFRTSIVASAANYASGSVSIFQLQEGDTIAAGVTINICSSFDCIMVNNNWVDSGYVTTVPLIVVKCNYDDHMEHKIQYETGCDTKHPCSACSYRQMDFLSAYIMVGLSVAWDAFRRVSDEMQG